MPSERVTEAIRRIVAARLRRAQRQRRLPKGQWQSQSQNYCEYCRCSDEFATESFTVEKFNFFEGKPQMDNK